MIKTLIIASFLFAQVIAGGNHRKIFSPAGLCSTYSDNFTTPGALIAPWTVITGYPAPISGGGYVTSPTTGWSTVVYVAGSGSGDQCAQVAINVIVAAGNSAYTGLALLMATDQTGYYWDFRNDCVQWFSHGTYQGDVTCSCPTPRQAGQNLTFSLVASTHTFTCAVDGDVPGTYSFTDTHVVSGGYPGIGVDTTNAAVQLSAFRGTSN